MESAELSEDWYSEDTATFGDRVAAAREQLAMTEADLARRLGIKVDTVQRWENDLAEPRANKLQMLSGILNVSLRWLLTGEGEDVDAPAEAAMAPEVSEILREFRALKSEMTRSVERMGVLEKRLRAAIREAEA
ncbi:MAG: helix-turn-helix transcriptional regulator [Pseudomonadota bacterium]